MQTPSDKLASQAQWRHSDGARGDASSYRLVSQIAEEALAEPALDISTLQSGHINSVYAVSTRSGAYVARIGQSPHAVAGFKREEERYALSMRLGIPVPKVVKQGQLDAFPYMILQQIIGAEASQLPDKEQLRVWEKLGEYSRRLGEITVPGMGFNCKMTKAEWLEQSLQWLFADNVLIERETLTESERDRFIQRVRHIVQWDFEPRMCHGDPTLRNAIQEDETGTIYLIDFGNSQGHRSPHFDLSNVSAWYHDSPEALDHFAAGMGLSGKAVEALEDDVTLLTLWRYIGSIKYAIESNREWSSEAWMTRRIRAMLWA